MAEPLSHNQLTLSQGLNYSLGFVGIHKKGFTHNIYYGNKVLYQSYLYIYSLVPAKNFPPYQTKKAPYKQINKRY